MVDSLTYWSKMLVCGCRHIRLSAPENHAHVFSTTIIPDMGDTRMVTTIWPQCQSGLCFVDRSTIASYMRLTSAMSRKAARLNNSSQVKIWGKPPRLMKRRTKIRHAVPFHSRTTSFGGSKVIRVDVLGFFW